MRVRRFLYWLAAGALVVALTAGGAVLLGGLANAAPPPGENGTLTFTPATGTDNTIPDAHTSGPCPEGSNVAQMEVTGPVGAATPTFPPDNPFLLTLPNATTFSTTGPFDVPGGLSLKAAADERGTQLAAGEFDFTVTCVEEQLGDKFGTFTGAIFFTSATEWQISDPNGPAPSPDPSPEPSPEPSPDPSPEPSPDPSPEPSPEPSPDPSPEPSPDPSPVPTPGGELLEGIIVKVMAALQQIIQFLLFFSQFALGGLQLNFGAR